MQTGDMPPILVCFDGSPDAEAAIDAGAALLPGRRAEIVHVWAATDVGMTEARRLMRDCAGPDDLAEALRAAAERDSQQIVERGVARARAAGWDAHGAGRGTVSGVWFEVARLAGEARAAAVVVGARGLGGARGALGSVSDSVVHSSAVPVLVVPAGTSGGDSSDGPLALAYDGSDHAGRALEGAAALLPDRRAVVLSVGREEAGELARAGAARAQGAGLPATARALVRGRRRGRGRAVAQALVGAAGEEGAAAIVLGSRGRSTVGQLVLGSVAMAVLHAADRPVLIVPSRPG